MKLWLDDLRTPPESWKDFVWVKTAQAANDALDSMKFDEVSLDHDLGLIDADGLYPGDGYDVVLHVEKKVREEGWDAPPIRVHTGNPVAERRMKNAIAAITRFLDTGTT